MQFWLCPDWQLAHHAVGSALNLPAAHSPQLIEELCSPHAWHAMGQLAAMVGSASTDVCSVDAALNQASEAFGVSTASVQLLRSIVTRVPLLVIGRTSARLRIRLGPGSRTQT